MHFKISRWYFKSKFFIKSWLQIYKISFTKGCYVKNITSKHIFARWQAILSNFDFQIEYIKGENNSIPDFLTCEFLQDSQDHSPQKKKNNLLSSLRNLQILRNPIQLSLRNSCRIIINILKLQVPATSPKILFLQNPLSIPHSLSGIK